MFHYQGTERRKDVRIGDKVNKVAVWVSATLITLSLGAIVQLMSSVISNQQTLIQQDAVQKEHQINFEEYSKSKLDRHELRIESLNNRYYKVDKRVTVLENYAN